MKPETRCPQCGTVHPQLAAAVNELETIKAILADPVKVHVNMLRGMIAPITMRQAAHIEGEAAVERLNRWESDVVYAERSRAALLESARHKPLGGNLWCWCDCPYEIAEQSEHSPHCRRVRELVYDDAKLNVNGVTRSDTPLTGLSREALESIAQYGSDTLSGRADGPDDRDWQREAVKEMTRRARTALKALPSSGTSTEQEKS